MPSATRNTSLNRGRQPRPEVDITGNEHALIVADSNSVGVYSFDRITFEPTDGDESTGRLIFAVTKASHHDRKAFS
ncbi:hypothetical protein ACIGO9_28485 [Nocardia asteroides]|uniref:hypothetical protein n=1 Tax=Nocardia asteroides TaxID=1824 RepID=UPI0037CC27F3